MAMLHTVMRPSMDRSRMACAGKFNGVAGAAGGADLADDGQHDVFGGDAGATLPSTLTSMFLAFLASSVCVAMTCSTSLVPMPCASAPNAPWVLVWLSPQTTVMPGRVAPLLGAHHVNDALALVHKGEEGGGTKFGDVACSAW